MTGQFDERPTWEILLEAAHRLGDKGAASFPRAELIAHVQRSDPSRERSSIDPIIQGLTENATGGPRSACGIVFRRIERGQYVLITESAPLPPAPASAQPHPGPRPVFSSDSS